MSLAVQPFSFLAGTQTLGSGLGAWPFDEYPTAGEPRDLRVRVTFSQPFLNAPLVHLGLTGFDIDHRDAARLSVRAEQVTAEGFDLVLGSWLNTRLWRAEVSWLALAPSG